MLRGVDLAVAPGERVALMGRNGAGKSTLLRVAAGLVEPTRGKVRRGGRVALLLQNPGDYALRERVGDELPADALAAAGLDALADRHPRDLSGGERQRLALAIVLHGERPAVVCLDEPTRGMDRRHKDALTALLERLAAAGHGRDRRDARRRVRRRVRRAHRAARRRSPGRRRADRRGARGRLVLRHADGAHPRRRRAAARGRRRAAAAGGGGRMSWVLASFLVLGLALTAGFGWYERSHPSARVLALVATLAALAALGRIAFAPLPSVKPTTDIVLLTGYVLGGAPGFAVGAVAALASNLFFGQGPWTPWQMAGWGGAGLFGAALAQLGGRELGRLALAAACAAAGLAFGALMNLSLWVTYSGDHTLAKLGAVFATSLPFDVAHALGNAAFCLAFGPALVRALQRFRTRFEVTWRPAPAATGVALALLALSPRCMRCRPRRARRCPPKSVAYLERAQNSDGGLGPAPGAGSTQMHTGWAALGLAAAGRNPRDVERGGRNMVDYIRAQRRGAQGRPRRALAHDPRAARRGRPAGARRRPRPARRAAARAGGRRLVRRPRQHDRVRDPRAARGRPLRRATAPCGRRRFIASQANDDGGFNFAGKGGPSGADDTGAALQALAAAGPAPLARRAARGRLAREPPERRRRLRAPVRAEQRAVDGLGDPGPDRGRTRPGRVHRGGSRSPIGYLRSLVTPSGAIRYSRTSAQTPVWVTAQALTALAGKPFPLRPAPRAGGAARAAAVGACSRRRRRSPRQRLQRRGSGGRQRPRSPSTISAWRRRSSRSPRPSRLPRRSSSAGCWRPTGPRPPDTSPP